MQSLNQMGYFPKNDGFNRSWNLFLNIEANDPQLHNTKILCPIGIIHLVRTQNFLKNYYYLPNEVNKYVCVSEVQNVSFLENLAYVLNGWSHTRDMVIIRSILTSCVLRRLFVISFNGTFKLFLKVLHLLTIPKVSLMQYQAMGSLIGEIEAVSMALQKVWTNSRIRQWNNVNKMSITKSQIGVLFSSQVTVKAWEWRKRSGIFHVNLEQCRQWQDNINSCWF